MALLDQGIPQAGSEYRAALLVKAADLDLLTGLFGDAAERYEAAAGLARPSPGGQGSAVLLLRAARCRVAAGDSEKAQALAASVIAAGSDASLSAAARLVAAWALAMQDRLPDAAAIAAPVAASPKAGPGSLSPEYRREARFILWLCAPSSAKAESAALLAAEFPGSPEALIASGAASAPPLPHWYLGGLGLSQQARKPSSPSPSAPPAAQAPIAPASASAPAAGPASPSAAAAAAQAAAAPAAPQAASLPSARGKRLQVGYFSKEDNAQALKEELASKGFTALVETRMRAAGAGKAEEKRWIVAVEGGKDIAKTQQSLKDAGYESYIIE